MLHVDDPVRDEVDGGDFEEVGLDYVVKSARTCLQGNGNAHRIQLQFLLFVSLRFVCVVTCF